MIPDTPGEEVLGMGERECRNCAEGIVAKALNPYFCGRRKRLPEWLEAPLSRESVTSSSQPRLFG